MSSRQIQLPNVGTVTLYKRKGNRSLRLSVATTGEVRVSLPYWLPYKAAEQFATSKLAWILAHQNRNIASLKPGQAIGKAHRLVFTPSAQAVRVTTRLKPNTVEISHPLQYDYLHPHVQQAARTAGIRALRKEAQHLLPIRLKQLSQQSGLGYNDVAVKHLKSRWGSCSSAKDITLNLFLMQLPWHLIDYVLLHELTHTKVMRHGAPFWQELELHAPQAKKLRKEIGNYHPVLA